MSSSTSADGGRLRLAAFVTLLLLALIPVRAQRTLPLTRTDGHLYAGAMLQDSLPVQIMLESGISFPLIDSALVWSNPGLFHPEKLDKTVRFRMAAGRNYVSRYKLAPGLSVAGSRSLCDTYVVDMGGRTDMYYPLNRFTTDSVEMPGIFGLDIAGYRLELLAEEDLPGDESGWTVCNMMHDERSGMYCVQGPLTLVNDRGRRTSCPAELVVDLGNAMLLALFTYKSDVKKFVSRSRVRESEGRTSSGRRLPVLQPAEVAFMDAYTFCNQPVLSLENPMRLPGHGFLGIRFFERFRVIFDFRHSRLWIAGPSVAVSADREGRMPSRFLAVASSADLARPSGACERYKFINFR